MSCTVSVPISYTIVNFYYLSCIVYLGEWNNLWYMYDK